MQLEFIEPELRQILQFVEEEVGMEPIITSLFRIGDKGVHGVLPLRGADVRVRFLNVGEDIAHLVNKTWEYDHTRPSMECAIIHGEGANLHLHLQVHPKTRLRNG